jgi:hypothetical protein
MEEQRQYIRENITHIAEKAFPDNIGNEWFIHNIIEHPKGIEVEVEPIPDDVGYPRFRFIIEFESPNEPNITYCYFLEDTGEWDLLFTG